MTFFHHFDIGLIILPMSPSWCCHENVSQRHKSEMEQFQNTLSLQRRRHACQIDLKLIQNESDKRCCNNRCNIILRNWILFRKYHVVVILDASAYSYPCSSVIRSITLVQREVFQQRSWTCYYLDISIANYKLLPGHYIKLPSLLLNCLSLLPCYYLRITPSIT